MDWNQISNYAARHTHRKSWGWGRPGRPASPRGTPAAVALGPGRSLRGLGPARAPGATWSAPPARGQPRSRLRGGFSSASGTGAALSDQRDSQRRAAAATAPEGLSDLRPHGSRCPLLGCGPGQPTAPPPQLGRAHCALTRCSRSPISLSPRRISFARRSVMAEPLSTGHSN